MRNFAITAVATFIALGAAFAQAGSFGRPCTTAPQPEWLSLEALKTRVEALGYKVQKAKIDNSCGEIYVRDKNGNRIELFVDPANGKIVGQL